MADPSSFVNPDWLEAIVMFIGAIAITRNNDCIMEH